MKISQIKKAGAAINEGAWVDNIPGLPGVSLKVCGNSNPKARTIAAEMISALPRGKRNHEDLSKIERRQIVEVLLVDWKGISDDNGDPLPYSRENLEKIMADSDLAVVFTEAVNYASGQVAEQISADIEDDAKN